MPADDPEPAPLVTVVLPCLNEEEAIAQCVAEARQALRKSGLPGEVVVVDNGSVDRSVERARESGAEVIYQPEHGYGAAVRSGIEVAKGPLVVMADADGTYDLSAIPKLLQPLLEGSADLVIGSRLDDAEKGSMPWLHRYVGTPFITLLLNRATRSQQRVRDSQSGLRAFRKDEVLKLHLTSTGMEFASEMLMRCSWAGFRMVEIPTTYSPRIGDTKLNRYSDGLRHLRQILLLSPEIFAMDPGAIMTLLALLLWALAALSQHGLDRVGSLGWLADALGTVFSIIGPITYCTGLGLKYRAESYGFRAKPPKHPLLTLIWRFFFVGVSLIGLSIALGAFLIVNFHRHPELLTRPATTVLSSVTISAAIVGIVLACAPVFTPFLTQVPRSVLPHTDPDG